MCYFKVLFFSIANKIFINVSVLLAMPLKIDTHGPVVFLRLVYYHINSNESKIKFMVRNVIVTFGKY